ncbi:MAG: hypothetical protein KF754_00590 [Planctomycetes bacterium]|nr:hypothetical protein [Planctomycetota bacterium]
MSSDAQAVHSAAEKVQRHLENSQALFGRKAEALVELDAVVAESAEESWGAGGALPIDPAAADRARAFVRALPDDLPLPEFAPEPDGSVSLDWIVSRTRLLSLSIGAGNRLAYAWLDGTDRGHAVAYFDGRNVPSRILTAIREIVGDGTTSLRAA